jgi:cephalosporin hydroxylase
VKDIDFENKVQSILALNKSNNFLSVAKDWHDKSRDFGYQYLMSCGGRPIIQDPQDIVAISEILWESKPDLVVETGVARGGSFMLHLMNLSFIHNFFPALAGRNWQVIGIDLNLSQEFLNYIEKSGLAKHATLINGSSVDPGIHEDLKRLLQKYSKKAIFLDSDHTHDHVLQELKLFSQYLNNGDDLIVMDTGVEFMPAHQQTHGRWGVGSNPYSAVQEFMAENINKSKFTVDDSFYERLGVTCFRGGKLRCISN